MVENTDNILKLNIKFDDKEEEMILKELVSIEKLKNIFIEKYKIPKNKVNNFDLCYYDKEGDIVSFEDNDNLFDLSTKESDSTYVLNLELFFYEGDSRIQSMRFSSRKCLNINNNNQIYQSNKIDNNNNENKNDNIKMAEVIFNYNGTNSIIQCKIEDKMKDICEKLCLKMQIDINKLIFIYGGLLLNLELKYKEVVNETDKKNLKMNILVYDNSSIINEKDIKIKI